MSDASRYEYKREQARIARDQAKDLRNLHRIAKCGLDLRISYGTKYVPRHIELRIADQFPIWADEYDAVAEKIEKEMDAMFSKVAL